MRDARSDTRRMGYNKKRGCRAIIGDKVGKACAGFRRVFRRLEPRSVGHHGQIDTKAVKVLTEELLPQVHFMEPAESKPYHTGPMPRCSQRSQAMRNFRHHGSFLADPESEKRILSA